MARGYRPGPYTKYLWTDAGWPVSATHPQSASWRYTCDQLGRLEKVNPDAAPGTGADARYTYDEVGNLHSTTYRNGVATTYTYNPRNWLRCLRTMLTVGTVATQVAAFDYDGALAGQAWPAETRLSPTGQRRAVMETVSTANRTVAYSYDLLSRLTKEHIQSATASPTGLVAYASTGTGQGYDRVGNRRSRQVTGTLPGVSAYTGHTFSERDLLNPGTGYTYDANGNTTADPSGAAYAYDVENRLVKVTQTGGTNITLAYDADGNRVKKLVDAPGTANDSTTLYLVDDRNPTGYAQVIEERDDAGATTVAYTYGLDLICQSTLNPQPSTLFYGYDGLGSVRYLTDEAGVVTDTYTYDAFGIQVASTGTTPNAYRYTGEQWDGDLGLYYLRARYYQPQLGRFWTMDSYEGNQSDPLGLHKYLHAHANPVNGVDPSGHEFTFVGTLTSLTTAEGLQGMKGGVETKVQWEMRDMVKQMANDFLPNDRNQALGQEGEEVWVRYLNKIPGFRTMRAKGKVSAVGPDVYGVVVKNGRIVLFIGEVKASEGRLPGVGQLKWNIMNGMRQMSAGWLDRYASEILEGMIDLGLQGLGESELKSYIKRGKVEAYLLGALKEWTDWRIRGFRLMHLGDDEVLPDITEGGFPEITNEHVVR